LTIPTLVDGKLYLRNQKEIVYLDLTGRLSDEAAPLPISSAVAQVEFDLAVQAGGYHQL